MLDVSSIMEKTRFILLDGYRYWLKLLVIQTQENPESAGKYPRLSGVIIEFGLSLAGMNYSFATFSDSALQPRCAH